MGRRLDRGGSLRRKAGYVRTTCARQLRRTACHDQRDRASGAKGDGCWPAHKDIEMGIVRFALKFPYTFYVLAALILFLGGSVITVMPEDIFPVIDIPVVSGVWPLTGISVPWRR